MKYKIEVSGRGCEAFIFKLTSEQKQRLWDLDVESGNVSYEEICEILNVEDYFSTDDTLMGIHPGSNHGEYLWMKVLDEQENIIWESDEDFNFEVVENRYEFNDGEYLLIEDYLKGHFWNFYLETEDEFNPKMLSCIVVELLDGLSEQITNIKYNDQDLEKEYVDTSSKGYTYYLS